MINRGSCALILLSFLFISYFAFAETIAFDGYVIDVPEGWSRHGTYYNKSIDDQEVFPKIKFMSDELRSTLADYAQYIIDLLYARATMVEPITEVSVNQVKAIRFIAEYNAGQTWARTGSKSASRILHYIFEFEDKDKKTSRAYSIIFSDKVDDFDRSIPEFEQIAKSLREKTIEMEKGIMEEDAMMEGTDE
ncbi:MAG: hypothetical protein JW869_01405 [Candidatus Omnitrophica bacterium]|nr:hypothetical protein [Candidatus Omnitrophota bacterium]